MSDSGKKTGLIPQLLEKVLQAVSGQGIDLILLLGDLVDNGNADGAEDDWIRIRNLLERFQKPILAVRGDHDLIPETYRKIPGDPQESVAWNGDHLIGFSDRYEPDGSCFRDWDDMVSKFEGVPSGLPVVVYQHNPIPPVCIVNIHII